MNIQTERQASRVWEWSVLENGEQIAAGLARTKGDATNDAQAWIDQVLERRARAAGLPVKGDVVEILPEWMDDGDDKFRFVATETVVEGQRYVRLAAFRRSDGERVIGTQQVELRHIVTKVSENSVD